MVKTLRTEPFSSPSLKEIFKWSNRCRASPNSFSRTTLPFSHRAFAISRLLLLSYWLAILIAGFVLSDDRCFFFTYLSHLHQLPILIYLFAATVCSFRDLGPDDAQFRSLPTGEGGNDGPPVQLRWHHWVTWTFYVVSFSAALLVSAMYPFLNDPDTKGGTPFDASFLGVSIHVFNFVIMMWELFANCIPVNFWHFPFTCAFSAIYAVILTSLHFSGVRSAVYSVIDYQNASSRAWVITAIMLVPAPVLSHTCMCLLYALKVKCFIHANTENVNEEKGGSSRTIESAV